MTDTELFALAILLVILIETFVRSVCFLEDCVAELKKLDVLPGGKG